MPKVEIMPDHFIESSLICRTQQQRSKHIIYSLACSTCKATGYIWYAIMNNAMLYKSGLLMGSDFTCFEAAAAVNAYVYNDTSHPHCAYHFFRYDHWSAAE